MNNAADDDGIIATEDEVVKHKGELIKSLYIIYYTLTCNQTYICDILTFCIYYIVY